jgi:uncharacterized cupin superfamily protein
MACAPYPCEDHGVARPNVFEDACEYDPDDPPGYRSGGARVGRAAGGEELEVKLIELPAGERLCPYHYEYVEEWLLVLDGEVEVRVPDGRERLARGELMRFPPGPAGAHRVENPGSSTARVLMFSSARQPSVAVYPDSDKVGVWTGNQADGFVLHRRDGQVPYFDGEA